MAITEPEFAPPWGESISASPDLVRPTDGFIQGGWPLTSANPTRGRFNWLLKQCHNGIRYFMSRGIPNWNSSETSYPTGAVVRDTFTDGAGFTRRSFYYAHGTPVTGTAPHSDATNWSLVLDLPIGQSTNWLREIWAQRNAKQQRRAGYDHGGLPGGLYRGWEEDWSDVAFTSQLVAPSSGAWANRWKFEYGVTGGPATVAGGGITIQPPQFSGPTPTGPRSVLVQTNPFPNPGATAWCLIESGQPIVVISDDTYAVLEWQGFPGGTCHSVGFSGSSQAGLSVENTALLGASIIQRAADTNLQLYTNAGSSVFTDLGVTSALRMRLEYYGANVSDNGAAQVIAHLDGVKRGQVAVSLGAFPAVGFLRARSATNVTSPGNVGLMKHRSNLNPGDLFI